MGPVEALERLGGVASAHDLLLLTSRRRLRTALDRRTILRAGHGRYALPAADQARRAAVLVGGYVMHLSAALHWGWQVRVPPRRPQVGVPHGRPLPSVSSADARRLPRGTATDGWATSPLATVLQCARDLPFADALAVADSALRHHALTYDGLQTAATARDRQVLLHATKRAANPFESALRALVIEEAIPVVPQFEIRARGLVLHPDLVDPVAGVVLEAESWEFHGKDKRAFEADCERYTALTATGWRVLRFTWAQVMHDPGAVRAVLRDTYAELAA
ncbi:hypothetical protein [Pimelobacter simplex]|uniref:hypothetical protein n=1 Tax=Nocardioides simplex TaxID=2045 RepID=UPI00193280A1|nr:hypothetical protein [Pimelobacter simplex]